MEEILHKFMNLLTVKVFLILVVSSIHLQPLKWMMDMRLVKPWTFVEIAIHPLPLQTKGDLRTALPLNLIRDIILRTIIKCLVLII